MKSCPLRMLNESVNARYSPLRIQKKILHLDKEKAKYCYLAFLLLFHFSAIIFHVDRFENCAKLVETKGEKIGRIYT